MSEHDDPLDRWIQRVVTAAGSDAPDHDQLTAVDVDALHRRWPVAAAAAAIAALGIAGVIWNARTDTPSPSATPTLPGTAGPSTASSEPDNPAASTSPPAPAVSEVEPTTTAPTLELARPIIDVDWCRPTWARTRDLVREGAYLWSRQTGMAVQLFVADGGGVPGRFAVALRVTSNLRFSADTANAEVQGQPAQSTFAAPKWGELLWRLPDGTEAYLRTSTMTSDELIALADTLEPRDLTEPVPGFDTSSAAYELAAESVTPISVIGIVDTGCETGDGGWMVATIVDGPLAQALFLTDRPAAELASRVLDDGRLLVVTGREDVAGGSGEALDSVRDATDDEWAALTAADANSFDPNRLPQDASSPGQQTSSDTPTTG